MNSKDVSKNKSGNIHAVELVKKIKIVDLPASKITGGASGPVEEYFRKPIHPNKYG